MEELRRKGIDDQLRNEEDQRRYEEMFLLKEQNKYLQQWLDRHEREEQSWAPLIALQTYQTHPAPQTHQTHPAPQTHQTHQTYQTDQSSKNIPLPDDVEDLKGHPFTDDIIDTSLPPKWKGLTIKLCDGSTNLDEHLNVFKTQMTLYTTNKAVWIAPTSLQEGLLDWFTRLPPNSGKLRCPDNEVHYTIRTKSTASYLIHVSP